MDRHSEIIGDYVFGGLQPERLRDLETEIQEDPGLAQEIDQLMRIASRLESMPEELRDIGEIPRLRLREGDAPAPAERRPRAARTFLDRFFGQSLVLRPALAVAAAVLLFVGGLSVGAASTGDERQLASAPAIQEAKLAPVGRLDAGATGSAAVERKGDRIRLRLSGLKPNRPGDFYEAWLMDPKNGLIGIGSFRVSGNGVVNLDLPVPVGTKRFPVVDISLQPANGKPTHSGHSVLRGTLS